MSLSFTDTSGTERPDPHIGSHTSWVAVPDLPLSLRSEAHWERLAGNSSQVRLTIDGLIGRSAAIIKERRCELRSPTG